MSMHSTRMYLNKTILNVKTVQSLFVAVSAFTDDQQMNRQLSSLFRYLGQVKSLYAAALGIEILCISAAEIGENTGLYLFGFNPSGIVTVYVMGYALAGFTTFITILGRSNLKFLKT